MGPILPNWGGCSGSCEIPWEPATSNQTFSLFSDNFYKKSNISATKQAIDMGPILPYLGGGPCGPF